jgi:hypothetical protein
MNTKSVMTVHEKLLSIMEQCNVWGITMKQVRGRIVNSGPRSLDYYVDGYLWLNVEERVDMRVKHIITDSFWDHMRSEYRPTH